MIKVDTGSPLIARYDDVVSKNICERIVNYVHRLIPTKYNSQGSLPWQDNDSLAFVRIGDVELQKAIEVHRFLLTQLVNNHYNEIVYPHFTDLVVWRQGKKMDFHKDDGYEGLHENQFKTRKYSMVLYLNDNYEGGETVIKQDGQADYISVPKQGSVVIFKSNEECIHGVNEVTSGTRVTLPTWFTADIEDCETIRGFVDKAYFRS
jgi:predicted 2-oxoglutarate/Fe(II)-dependent dioxygenase YbiX